MNVQPYLFFDGRCEEAIRFYQEAIGAKVVMLMHYSDGPEGEACGEGVTPPPADKVMHATLQIGDSQIMASDGYAQGRPEFKGVSLSLSLGDDAAAKRAFDALAEGGKVEQPLMATFFASSFGIVADRFGVSWMVIKPNDMPAG